MQETRETTDERKRSTSNRERRRRGRVHNHLFLPAMAAIAKQPAHIAGYTHTALQLSSTAEAKGVTRPGILVTRLRKPERRHRGGKREERVCVYN